MENLDKDSLIRNISDKTGYTIGDARHFLNVFIEIFGECILDKISIDVRGFGHLYFQTIPERDGFKPTKGKKGEGVKMHYPETTRVIFKLASNLRSLAKMELVEESEDT